MRRVARHVSPTFPEDVGPFLAACPGPALLAAGLRIAALQRVHGIPGLHVDKDIVNSINTISYTPFEGGGYLRAVGDVAERLGCSPGYLSDAARRRGYHYSHALRWIRFLHFVTLKAEGCPTDQAAWRLGFADVAGLTRFTRALHGRTLSQLPVVPLSFWVRWAIEDVFLGPPGQERA